MNGELKKMAHLLRLGVPTLEAARQVHPRWYDRLARGDELATLLPDALQEAATSCPDLPLFLSKVSENEDQTSRRCRQVRAAMLYPGVLLLSWLVFCLLLAPGLVWLAALGGVVYLALRPWWNGYVLLREQADFLRWLAFFLPFYPLPRAAALARESAHPAVWSEAGAVCEALEAGDTLAQALDKQPWANLLTVEEPSHLVFVSQVLERRCNRALSMLIIVSEPVGLALIGVLVLAVAAWCYPLEVPW
ncbi:MAG: hypothetical protein KC800_23375 [Candidatus Eremiobacteraeota bacterium]|nr:hypothetical protein [Candidatus Eremiobacteraeota bacterium]